MLRSIGVRLGLAGVGVIATLVVSAFGVSSAMAAAPGGEYAVFSQCPVSNPAVSGCLVFHIESGEVTVGKLGVPIVAPQTLQAGLINVGEYGKEIAAAANGETLPRTPQRVPGGLSLVKCEEITGVGWFERGERRACEAIFENRASGLYATIELAARASSIGLNEIAANLEEGVALSLPIKIKLENPLLGNECYIGSETDPIVINLTTGIMGSLQGKKGKVSSRAEGGILVISDNTLVGDTFAAPEASGCGFGGQLDSLVNARLGLPAAAGTNTAILNYTHEQANVELVQEAFSAPSTPPPPRPPWPPHHHGRWVAPHPHPRRSLPWKRG